MRVTRLDKANRETSVRRKSGVDYLRDYDGVVHVFDVLGEAVRKDPDFPRR